MKPHNDSTFDPAWGAPLDWLCKVLSYGGRNVTWENALNGCGHHIVFVSDQERDVACVIFEKLGGGVWSMQGELDPEPVRYWSLEDAVEALSPGLVCPTRAVEQRHYEVVAA